VKVYSLSIHADYKCRHSGACCTADWDVPVELPIYRGLEEALRSERLVPAGISDDRPLIVEPDLPDDAAAMLARTTGGDCVFFHRESSLCVVHRDLGEAALPATCRLFPRLAVRDWRGTFITLSHFCPTAASMLFREDVPLEIVEGPAAFPPGDYEGLTVDPDAWSPMLHPRMLMDLDGYSAWERHMVQRCAQACAPESVVATLLRDARRLRLWEPGSGSLADAVAALPANVQAAAPHDSLTKSLMRYAEVMTAVPDDLMPEPDEDGLEQVYVEDVRPAWSSFDRPLNAFLAAKAFASWTAYQGRGLLSIVRGLDAALALVRVEAARMCRDNARELDADLLREAFRSADFLLNHLAVGEDLARRWSRAERQSTQVSKTATTGP
jgi:Fe-S-cluster containining protein